MTEAPSQPKKRRKYSCADKYEIVLYYEANDLSSTVDRYFPGITSLKRHSAKNLVLAWASPKNRANIEANAKSTKTQKKFKNHDASQGPWKLTSPKRPDIVQWVTTAWEDLAPSTIVAGFTRCNFINKERADDVLEDKEEVDQDLITRLMQCNLHSDEISLDDTTIEL